ncbi:MAG TPA: TonB-dependent receptor [Gemmatimonadaceae bacterium]|nr:TonB-dependent receptor [Gemmatimonadaceae bacterium]
MTARVVALLVLVALDARGQACAGTTADSSSTAVPTPVSGSWATPLDRRVSMHARGISLRDALDRLSAAARVRLSYSAEFLQLDAATCVFADSTMIGDVLSTILHGTTLTPIAAGGDQVVLAPQATPPVGSSPTPDIMPSLGLLDRVVVTGSATAAPERALTVAVDVVDGGQLRAEHATSLSDALDDVPGMWIWAQSPSSLLASYASIRGASSFGISYPKIYIDGIEVASPLLVTRFDPDVIDHVEVVRGPQEAALYGADAISGVVNIVTRTDAAGPDGTHTSILGSAGLAQSDFATHDPFAQQHSFAVRSGTNTRSIGLDASIGTMGDFIPDGASRDLSANVSGRIIGSSWTLTGLARAYQEQAGSSPSPLLAAAIASRPDSGPAAPSPIRDTGPQTVREYTVGSTASLAQGDRWTHSITAGLDGYQLANVSSDGSIIPTEADSALRAAQGSAARGSIRLSSAAQLGESDRARGTLTFALDQSDLSEQITTKTSPNKPGGGGPGGSGQTPLVTTEQSVWQGTTGATAQLDGAVAGLLFLTGGLRAERDVGFTSTQQTALLPLLGAAVVRDAGPLTVKLRTAYGKGIRPAESSTNAMVVQTLAHSTQASLSPETQSGVEAGIDVLAGRTFTFQATRYDQTAAGLIQQVAVASAGQAGENRIAYELENVGEIRNNGWELQASARVSDVSLTGTFSTVDSRVVTLTHGYTGDLQPGDRMLDVPARTMSATARWNGIPRWDVSLTAARAEDWINYDELALATDFAVANRPPQELVGAALRNYWLTYPGTTRLRAAITYAIRPGMSLEITGENLLNTQTGEPDNLTVLPGRTILSGLRVRF